MNIERRTSHRTASEQVLVWLSSLGVALMCATFTWFLFTAIVPYNVISKIEITVEDTRAGDYLTLQMAYCKDQAVSPKRVIITMQNAITIVVPSQNVRIPAGCRIAGVREKLSPEIPAGAYTLEMLLVYEPYPWRTITHTFRSNQFKIGPAGVSTQ